MKMKGWVELMCMSSNPKTRAHGQAVKRRLEEEYRMDIERLKQSPGWRRWSGERVSEGKG